MLILDNDDVRRVFDVRRSLAGLRDAYCALARGEAVVRSRSQTYVPLPEPQVAYCLKTMEGALPGAGYIALRITSDIVAETTIGGLTRRDKLPRGPGGTYCGLIILFSTSELAPVAMIHDGYIQVYRVACTSALATSLLAREDARVLGVLGSSGQAWAHVVAMQATRPLAEVRVYSPSPEHRAAFAARVHDELGLPARAVPTAEAAVAQSDIVVAATNTNVPIVAGQWLRPGTHVVSIASGDETQQRRELDDAVLAKARQVIVHTKALAMQQNHGDLAGPIAAGVLTWERVHDLAALIVGQAPGRQEAADITVFKNNAGLGLQFAAVGGQVYADARAAGLGRELPTHWFMETMKP